MAPTTAVVWFLSICILTPGQVLNNGRSDHGICKDMACNSLETLSRLNGCVVVLGDLKLFVMEKTNSSSFKNMTFPDLREVTGFMIVYRVIGLETLGQLFPNLARIRGTQLFNNYGLIVHDMPNLREVGLYNLLKIDRGGVVVWGGPHTCFVHSVDWNTIAPRSRHVLAPPDRDAHCNLPCRCTDNLASNFCWNNKKCQRFLEGPDSEECNSQCLGCRNTNTNTCTLCRYNTYKGKCVPKCPNDTLILPENQYCVTDDECKGLNRWKFNNTCINECPVDYIKENKTTTVKCKLCLNCQKTCEDQKIQTLSNIQQAERCVYINGSLILYVRALPGAVEELRTYLGRIQEVTDYVEIYGSLTINTLDFLSSLRIIRGRKLLNNEYSLVIHDMQNLQSLFTPNVTSNLKILRGKLKVQRNPMLCNREIEEIENQFPEKSNETDIPPDLNGYSGGCAEESVDLKVKVLNATAAKVTFSPLSDPKMQYTVLYIRLPPGTLTTIVPETCSESEWYAVNAPDIGVIELTSLRPASTYAVCIETYSYSYNPLQKHLARSNIVNFTTPIGNVAAPFLTELVASSSQVVVLRWVNHKDYKVHITRYELDVSLVEIHAKDITARDHCNDNVVHEDPDYSRHAVVLKPPRDYDSSCESMCGILSTATAGAMVEDYIDMEACSLLDIDCDINEEGPPKNSTFGRYVRTLSLNISSPRKDFQVGGLAPFRDYRFRLRACVGDKCSMPTKSVVRTLRSPLADIPKITYYNVNAIGHISVVWEPPEVTNGPILAYSVRVLPYIKGEANHILPQSWCVLSHHTQLTVRSQIVEKYLVTVCSMTLGSLSACSDWHKIMVPSDYSYLSGVSFGILLIAVSIIVGYVWRQRNRNEDLVPLVDRTSIYSNFSEPPISEFELLYSVPLHDTLLEY